MKLEITMPNEMKWNESGFRPPLCTYRLNYNVNPSFKWIKNNHKQFSRSRVNMKVKAAQIWSISLFDTGDNHEKVQRFLYWWFWSMARLLWRCMYIQNYNNSIIFFKIFRKYFEFPGYRNSDILQIKLVWLQYLLIIRPTLSHPCYLTRITGKSNNWWHKYIFTTSQYKKVITL